MSDATDTPPKRTRTGELRAIKGGASKAKTLAAQLLGGVIGCSVALGAAWMFTGSVKAEALATAQAASSDAGEKVKELRGDFERHKADESAAIRELKEEVRANRNETRQVYEFNRTGRRQPDLEKPLPPIAEDVP